MQKVVPKKIYESIIQVIAEFPSGASITVIMENINTPLPRRTLQRYLSKLVKDGFLLANGDARGRKYYLRPKELSVTPRSFENEAKDLDIPLSSKAQDIENRVTQPIQKRTHVGYNREFLDGYHPNTTYYLDQKTRNKLQKIGDSGEENQPAGTYARHIFNRLLIDLSWNSSRLEGNTYSLLETERLLNCNDPSEGKDLKETQMILNHKEAIEFLIDPSVKIDRFTILNLHALLSNNLLRDPSACGQLRSIPVGISSTVFIPLAIPQIIDECFDQIIHTAHAIQDPFEQAFFMMVHLPYLQPFEDVNKRVSRLSANIPLIQKNLCPLSFVDVPEDLYISGLLGVYELNQVGLLRDIFVWAYERSCSLYAATKKSLGDPDPFRMKYRTQMKETIAQIVRNKMNKLQAHAYIESQSTSIMQNNQKKFIEVVEAELLSLHNGNIARYQITPNEYNAWHTIWTQN